MTKKLVRVFPDYCSSGVWIEGGNADPEELGISPELQIALEYWHQYWENVLCGEFTDDGWTPATVGEYWKQKWVTDGETLVRLMNEENSEYEFVKRFGTEDI